MRRRIAVLTGTALMAFAVAAMQRGALDLTTALIYPPGSFAKTPELIELAEGAATMLRTSRFARTGRESPGSCTR